MQAKTCAWACKRAGVERVLKTVRASHNTRVTGLATYLSASLPCALRSRAGIPLCAGQTCPACAHKEGPPKGIPFAAQASSSVGAPNSMTARLALTMAADGRM